MAVFCTLYNSIKYWKLSNNKLLLIHTKYSVLRKAFDAFDRERSGSIPTDMVADILRLMGQPFNKKILDELIEEVDADSNNFHLFNFQYITIIVFIMRNLI